MMACSCPPLRSISTGLSPTHILLQHVGVLFAGKLLPIGHTHHVRVNLQAVAIGIVEIKRATAAATEITTPLDTVNQRPIDQLDALGLQMGQGLEELVTVLDLKGDLLDEPLARALRGHIHACRGGAEHHIVVHVVKAQESRLRAIRALVAIGDRTPQHLGIEAERFLEVGYQNPHVSNALNVDTHKPLPPCLVFSYSCTISCRRCPSGSWK